MTKKILVAIISLASVVLIAGFTFAWFIVEANKKVEIKPGSFTIGVNIYLEYEENEQNKTLTLENIKSNSSLKELYFDEKRDAIILDGSDETKINYVGNLRVKLKIKNEITARYRVKIIDEWHVRREYKLDGKVNDTAVDHEFSEYRFTPFHIFERTGENYTFSSTDGYIYSNKILNKGVNVNEIDFISGAEKYPTKNNYLFRETCYVYLKVKLEVVQLNRYTQIWNIGSIPVNDLIL